MNCTIVNCPANPSPCTRIGVPPVSAAPLRPFRRTLLAVLSTLETLGRPAYSTLDSGEEPASVRTETGMLSGPTVGASSAPTSAGASIWISVPLMYEGFCQYGAGPPSSEDSSVGSPKSVYRNVKRSSPTPWIVTSVPLVSLARLPGPAEVETDVIFGGGT